LIGYARREDASDPALVVISELRQRSKSFSCITQPITARMPALS